MSYDYYCTGCGAKLNNGSVLFDMIELLGGRESLEDGTGMQVIKFRLSEKGLMAWAQGKQPCELSLSAAAAIIANGDNLNDRRIAALSFEDIRQFLTSQQRVSTVVKEKNEDTFGGWGDPDPGDPKEPEPEEEPVIPPAIDALIEKDTTADSRQLSVMRVTQDLKKLQAVFMDADGEEKVFRFSIQLLTEKDDRDRPVLVGANVDTGSYKLPLSENRVCPVCGERVFRKAGTALHKSVVFIGARNSGKTTAILALTHYAINHMQDDLGVSLWRGAESLDGIEDVELLDRNETLLREMNDYSAGFAPQKTNISKRSDAYSSTILIRSRAGERQVTRILTLTDLPGELCRDDGTLNADRILNTFPVATVCDAFVLCFDTSMVGEAAEEEMAARKEDAGLGLDTEIEFVTPGALISNTCRWADAFQGMLITSKNHESYVPTMLLYTKCQEIEGNAPEQHVTFAQNPLQRLYMFCRERVEIGANKIYKVVSDKLDTAGGMNASYQSMLRCSPLGYRAPTRARYEERKAIGLDVHVEKPSPKNIDRLMQWLLCVSGCLSLSCTYQPRANEQYILNNVYLSRPQYRRDKPIRGNEVQEAVARCCLFSNPGRWDESITKVATDKTRLKLTLGQMWLSQKQNDE